MSAWRGLAVRVTAIVSGWMVLSFGIAVLVLSDVGVAPYDALNVGVAGVLGVLPGTALWVSGSVLVSLAWAMGQRPGFATPVGVAVVGVFLNVLVVLLPVEPFGTGEGMSGCLMFAGASCSSVFFVVAAVLLIYAGVSLVVASGLGAGPTEVFMLALTRRGLKVRSARWLVEGGCVVGAVASGGPVGVLTLLIVVVSGPVLAAVLPPAAGFVSRLAADDRSAG